MEIPRYEDNIGMSSDYFHPFRTTKLYNTKKPSLSLSPFRFIIIPIYPFFSP
jgi:hypothetical protein